MAYRNRRFFWRTDPCSRFCAYAELTNRMSTHGELSTITRIIPPNEFPFVTVSARKPRTETFFFLLGINKNVSTVSEDSEQLSELDLSVINEFTRPRLIKLIKHNGLGRRELNVPIYQYNEQFITRIMIRRSRS